MKEYISYSVLAENDFEYLHIFIFAMPAITQYSGWPIFSGCYVILGQQCYR